MSTQSQQVRQVLEVLALVPCFQFPCGGSISACLSLFPVEAIRVTIMAGVTAVAGVTALHDVHRWLDPPAVFVQQCSFLA